MAIIPVTLLYGSLSALLVGALGLNVSRVRGVKKCFVGDAPDAELTRVIRAHGNATEWVPLLIVLLLMLEIAGVSATVLHLFGGTLLAGRLAHAAGVLGKNPLSVVGATVTYVLVVAMPVYGLILHFR